MSMETNFSVHNYYETESPSGHVIPVPVRIGVDILPEELEMCLRTVSKGHFLPYQNISAAELLIYMLMEKLQVYYQHYPDEARNAAEQMIRILQSVDTDDDSFPSGQITAIQSIVHIV